MIAAALAPPDKPVPVGDDSVRARNLGLDREFLEPAGLRIETADLFPIALNEPYVAPRIPGQVVWARRARGGGFPCPRRSSDRDRRSFPHSAQRTIRGPADPRSGCVGSPCAWECR